MARYLRFCAVGVCGFRMVCGSAAHGESAVPCVSSNGNPSSSAERIVGRVGIDEASDAHHSIAIGSEQLDEVAADAIGVEVFRHDRAESLDGEEHSLVEIHRCWHGLA